MLASLALVPFSVALAAPVRIDVKRVDAVDPTITLLLDVRDAQGATVGGWTLDDVSVTIDGTSADVRRVSRFADSGEAFGTMLLFDTSCSMKNSMEQVHKAANVYIDGMSGGDVASFAWFNDASYGETNPWSRNRDKLRELVTQLRAVGQKTRFYEALNKVITEIDRNPDSPRYRTVLVLSDGIDEGSPDPFTFDRAVRLSQEQDVPVNAVGFLPGRDTSGLPVLQALAHDTHGYYALAEDEDEIAERFQEFQNSIHSLLLVEIQAGAMNVGDREVSVVLRGASGDGVARTRLELEAPWEGAKPSSQDQGDEDESDEGLFGLSSGTLVALAALGGTLLLALAGVGAVAFRRASAPPTTEASSGTTLPPLPPPSPAEPAPQEPPPVVAAAAPPRSVTHRIPEPAAAPVAAPAAPAPQRTVFRPAGAAPTARLVLSGGRSIYLFQRGPQSIFGSDPGRCDSVCDEPTISGTHAVFTWGADGRLLIEDPGSTNGTYLGGIDIRHRGPVALQDGQSVQLGTVHALFQLIG